MSNLNLVFRTLYHIDREQETTEHVNLEGENDLLAFVKRLVAALDSTSVRRTYYFSRDTIESKKAIESIVAGDSIDKHAKALAERLLATELTAQKRVKQIATLQRGSLLICHIRNGSVDRVLICKVEHSDFLDESELSRRVGLPFEKQALKAAIGEYNQSGKIAEMNLYDSGSRVSEYWWRDFFELTESRSNNQNTDEVFTIIDKAIGTELKPISKADFVYLRNDFIRFFKNEETFTLKKFRENVLEKYKPISEKVDLSKLTKKVVSRCEYKGIDDSFDIDISNIKSKVRFRSVINLTNALDLHIKDDLNINNTINSFNENGRKGIKIFSDEGYKYFQGTLGAG